MSKKDETASDEERDGRSTDSVFDFLYHDVRRVGSFLAQFDYSGHLQQVSSTETVAKSGKRGFSVKVAGTVPVGLGLEGPEGSITLAREPEGSGSEAQERVYDPLWSNALSILNAAMLPKIWQSLGLRDIIARQWAENTKAQWSKNPANAALKGHERDRAEKAQFRAAENLAKVGLDVIEAFPHSAQCTVKGTDFSVWSTLSPDGMVGSVADLSLKHGTEIPGEWHLLGVLDALPNPIPEQTTIHNTGIPQHLGPSIANFSNLARTLLGRAPEAYGMTALLLFREVSAGGKPA